ncbi:uncharacterized protein LOC116768855 isoform X3 [Danaus plexippus]|uniref:uncharacterized protein LOC116768855 isoform X3 n=1 Tax=Danaus plexippus TaxID=13037 RepID=UPI002AB05BD7|nr:uncharacterized protein LOC116768855 isoform X3 [Danaus plexippus]
MFDLSAIKNVFLIVFVISKTYAVTVQKDINLKENENSHLEVRAVMIKCKIRETASDGAETDIIRFQREELFKHNALSDCKQKLTVTVKACSEPGQDSGDEYIPIEHVLGANRKRIRLLHPYVLRLQRQLPFQVYKLRRIDTVTGIIGVPIDKLVYSNSSKRLQRDAKSINFDETSTSGVELFNTFDHANKKPSFSIRVREPKNFSRTRAKYNFSTTTCGETVIYHQINESLVKRFKRKAKNRKKEFLDKWNAKESSNVNIEKDINFDEEHFNTNNLNDEEMNHKKIQTSDIKKSSYFDSSETIDQEKEPVAEGAVLKNEQSDNVNGGTKMFALFEIGDPDLYYNARVQLFEKLSTPEGKTVWNDLTMDEIARVSSLHPEWSDRDINVRYKPINWLPREKFTLPHKRLSLVVPLRMDSDNPIFDKHGDFVIVPNSDIITVRDARSLKRRDKPNNLTETSTQESTVKLKRQVVVRVSRALMAGSAARLKIIARGTDHFLKLPHTRRHHAQIDIEGRADNNELVLVGAFGRLTTIVSDTTRKSRSILTIQATNTGLAAARFRVVTRECNPELSNQDLEKNENTIGPILLAPRHSGTFRLNIPIENAIESAHCVVSLVNQDDESVAIRNVRIIRDDRCFCVWHCDCVCLRLVKAVLGLILPCVGSNGLYRLFQKPRKLDHYYESSLRAREVIYDADGWPVHPDSKQRNVRLVSLPMEFILNLIFFIILPCIMIWEALSKLTSRLRERHDTMNDRGQSDDIKKCFSTQDVQSGRHRLRRRRDMLQRWMTPHAEQLSTDIWKDELTPPGSTPSDSPLLIGKNCCSTNKEPAISSDSDQEDTEYVLMQMQKSRESLARCQQSHPEGQTTFKWNKNIGYGNKK